ncbi:DUF2271 domain-containing protein [Aliiglaciecola sp. 3_MG-2023]|uniref:DUF2271 domain-containing protein n=1 Tax=Aliiglaciecola sp. 3_MG-2023 TaxID=3062644 RepID=UPI0026E11841|nr:DUF2271 domain-containing protein [Aliiglaciecola sp. 3_MG-2023]MDO6694153.1 DUF2271 domain-containing protein [Aliiglaciecola sp. 3_MG-2023]
MNTPKVLLIFSTIFSVFSTCANSETLTLDVQIPQLKVAEYHSPYVAVWLESKSRKSTQIAVWYDVKMADNEGQEWLKDIRQWWRRGGRSLDLPYDGITSATRGPGSHQITIDLNRAELKELKPGDYKLRIEAAREVGGRELIEIPLTLPLDKTALPISKNGTSELGKISLSLQTNN